MEKLTTEYIEEAMIEHVDKYTSGNRELDLNVIPVEVKVILAGIDIGDATVILSSDESGLVLELPKEISGYHPGEEYELGYSIRIEEPKMSVIQAIDVKDKLEKIVREIDNLIIIADNKDFQPDSLNLLRKMRKDVQNRLEVLEEKFRNLEI